MDSPYFASHRSNFEIADLDFFRGEAYSRYFDHLDRAGGFSYERWGGTLVPCEVPALASWSLTTGEGTQTRRSTRSRQPCS